MQLNEIIDAIATDRLHQALVDLWLFFYNDGPGFVAAEIAVLDRGEPEFKKEVDKVFSIITGNEKLKIRNQLPRFSPLALLRGLDDYLFLRYDRGWRKGPGQIAKISAGNATYSIHRRAIVSVRPPRHDAQAGHLYSWMKHHTIVPEPLYGITLSVRQMSMAVFSPRILTGHTLKVFVASFTDRVKPEWKEKTKSSIITEALSDPEKRWLSILDCLKAAAAANADIVLLPELTVCPELRERVARWLILSPEHPFSLVLPGSYHQDLETSQPESEQLREPLLYNRAVLFSGTGREVLSHCKYIPFGEKERREGICPGTTIELLETPIGLFAMPICRDFNEEGAPLSQIWDTIVPDWILVPAMGDKPSLSAHKRKAESLLRSHGITSAVANQDAAGVGVHHGFVCSPGDGGSTSGTLGNIIFSCATVRFKKKS